MSLIQNLWKRFFPPVQPLPAGVYHCQMPSTEQLPYRLHLRIEPDSSGILIINASTVVHLNQSAAEYAFHLVNGTDEDVAAAEIARRYAVKKEIVKRDYQDLISRLKTLVETQDLDPVAFLDFERQTPYASTGSAPYRIDCTLTYRLPSEGAAHLAPLDRVSRELTREEWQMVLDKSWNAGVPHVLFTGGEPTLRPDLPQLILHAEHLGMVAGLITDGLRLAEKKYLHELLQSGLDHVMLLLDPTEDQSWEALRDTMAEDIAVTVHLTLTQHNQPQVASILDRLVSLEVKNLSLSADSPQLKDALDAAREAAAERQLRLVWDMPVPYSHFNPVALELQAEAGGEDAVPHGDGQAWIYVEPDGDVLTGQGHYRETLGNLLVDSFETVWQHRPQPVEGHTVGNETQPE